MTAGEWWRKCGWLDGLVERCDCAALKAAQEVLALRPAKRLPVLENVFLEMFLWRNLLSILAQIAGMDEDAPLAEMLQDALKVRDPQGLKAGQKLLDSLIGELAIDLPKFMQAPANKKAEMLLSAWGCKEEMAKLNTVERTKEL